MPEGEGVFESAQTVDQSPDFSAPVDESQPVESAPAQAKSQQFVYQEPAPTDVPDATAQPGQVPGEGQVAGQGHEVWQQEKAVLESQASVYRELLRMQQQQAMDAEMQRRQVVEQYSRPADPFDGLDPESPITVGAAKQWAQQNVERRFSEEVGQLRRQYRESLAAMTEEVARMKYQDYNDVAKLAAELCSQDQSLLLYIANQPNPAEAAYKVGQGHPKYLESIRKAATAKVVGGLKAQAEKPRTLAKAPGQPQVGISDSDRFAKMSLPEILMEAERVKRSGTL